MSNRRKLRPTHPLTEWDASLDSARIPGGCDTCDAHQTVHVIAPAVTQVRVHTTTGALPTGG
jgi:hypothetical protein